MNNIFIQNGDVVLPDRSVPKGTVVLAGSRIVYAGKYRKTSRSAIQIDAGGGYVTPGLIDVHIHGAGLVGWETCTSEGLEQVSATLLAHGILRFVPTMMANETLIRRMAELLETASCRDRIPGLYVEGPFVNLQKRGGIQEQYIRPVSLSYLKKLQQIASGLVVMMTFAPELAGAAKIPSAMHSLGILPCVGHSMARADQAEAVCGQERICCTHLYNTMTGLDHREPGLAAFALNHDQVFVELNPDGTHVAPELLQVTRRAKSGDRIVLISDAILTAGAPPGIYEYMNLKVRSTEKGAYYLESGTLVGSTVLLNVGLQRYMTFTGAPVYEAVRLATLNPATLLGLGQRTGSLEVGKYADVAIFSRDFTKAQAVFWKGKRLYPPSDS